MKYNVSKMQPIRKTPLNTTLNTTLNTFLTTPLNIPLNIPLNTADVLCERIYFPIPMKLPPQLQVCGGGVQPVSEGRWQCEMLHAGHRTTETTISDKELSDRIN